MSRPSASPLSARGDVRVTINDLVLPPALVSAMHSHKWRAPSAAVLMRVFRERPGTAVFLGLEAMRARNLAWRDETDRAYLGRADPRFPPGDIDPTRSLLLGEIGADLPFALDYRDSETTPRVLYLHSGGDGWITIARRIEQLLSRLDLELAPAPRPPLSRP